MNSEKALLRRHEDNLNVCGMGIIILGAWDVLKVIMRAKELFQIDIDLEVPEDRKSIAIGITIAVVAILILLIALVFLLHIYIGRNAMKNAKGQPYKKGYSVWAVITLVLSALSMAAYVGEFKKIESIDTTIASCIVDLTSIYIFVCLVISTRKIKQLRAEQTEQTQG